MKTNEYFGSLPFLPSSLTSLLSYFLILVVYTHNTEIEMVLRRCSNYRHMALISLSIKHVRQPTSMGRPASKVNSLMKSIAAPQRRIQTERPYIHNNCYEGNTKHALHAATEYVDANTSLCVHGIGQTIIDLLTRLS